MDQVFEGVGKSESEKEYYLTELEKIANEKVTIEHGVEMERALAKCKDLLEEENEELTKIVNELQEENDDLVNQVGELIIEAQDARRSFTGLQIAVSILIFVYGILYGTYFKC